MTDVVERLRRFSTKLDLDAAAEIDQLRADNKRLGNENERLRKVVHMVRTCPDHWSLASVRRAIDDMMG